MARVEAGGGGRATEGRGAAAGMTGVPARGGRKAPSAAPVGRPKALGRAAGAREAAKSRAAAPVARREPGRWRAIVASGRLAALLAAMVLGGALGYALNAGAFSVRRVEVAGGVATSPQQVAAAGRVLGHNVFTVDPQQIAERIVALPTVREAEVWTELPDRLVVRLVERRAALTWQAGESRALVDEEGFVIAVNPGEDGGRGLPVLQVRDAAPPRVGERVDTAVVRTALAVARPPAGSPALPIVGLEYTPRGGLVLTGDGGRQIVFGGEERLREKLAVSDKLLRGERDWRILDVTDPDRPVYK